MELKSHDAIACWPARPLLQVDTAQTLTLIFPVPKEENGLDILDQESLSENPYMLLTYNLVENHLPDFLFFINKHMNCTVEQHPTRDEG